MGAEQANGSAGDAGHRAGTFGALLRVHRRAAGLSQRELAASAGVGVTTVRDLEQELTHRPRPRSIDALVVALQLSGDAELGFRRAALSLGRDVSRVRDGPTGHAVAPAGGAGAEGRVRVAVLGPLVVHRGAEPIAVSGVQRRAVLGRLALSANTPVPVADLIDLLWDGRSPGVAVHAVHTHVSRLRSALRSVGPGPNPTISRTPAGYQLTLADDQLDLIEFRRAARSADAAGPDQALDLFATALAQWRGTPLGDVSHLRDHPLVTALVEERMAMALRYADLAIGADRSRRCLPMLQQLAADHPLNEPVHARLILALAAEHRQADALAVFTVIRRRLIEELGIEPGWALAAAHQRVLRQEVTFPDHAGPAGPYRHVPAQLPAAPLSFAGRDDALAALDRLVGTSVSVAVVFGTAGVGKTTLAVHWAHRVRDRFPDGQLYVNLRGFHPGAVPMSAREATHGFLVALGVPAKQIPADPDAQTGLYRTLLADRRVLVVLDNARNAEQVRSLVPGAAGCMTVVTSRHRLVGMVATEGALPVPLDLLTDAEARVLLTHRLGHARATAEPDAIGAIVARCAHLPLALAIAAARALTRPGTPLASLAADLTGDDRLDVLSTDEPGTDVRAVFARSCQDLTGPAYRLFRLFGLHRGPDLDTAAAAALAGLSTAHTAPLLAELTGVHLLVEPSPGRYSAHDLLQAYAADRAHADESPTARHDALARLVGHFRETTRAAVAAISPGERDAGPTGAFSDPVAAQTWLDAERANLISLARHGRPADTVALAAAAFRYFDSGFYTDAHTLHGQALDAARALGDQAAQALATHHLGITCSRLARYTEAARYHRQALDLYRTIGDRAGEGRSLAELGVTSWRLGDYVAARTHHQAALDVFRAIGDRHGEAMQLVMFGIGNRQVGDAAASREDLRRALHLYRTLGHALGTADALNNLGLTHQVTGDHRQAVEDHQHALAIFRELGHRPGEASALNNLGRALRATGHAAAAVSHHQEALTMYRTIGERGFEAEAINGLAAAQAAAGDLAAARDTYTTALHTAEQAGDRHEQAAAHNGLAAIHTTVADTHTARHHQRAAHTIHAELGLPAPPPRRQ